MSFFSARTFSAASFLVAALLYCLFLPAQVLAQEFRIEPSVVLSEEYNDNIFLQRSDKSGALISFLSPSLRLHYATSFWDWDINYAYTYYYYYYFKRYDSAGNRLNDHDQTHALSARNRTEFVKDILFLEVRDNYARVSQNIAVDYTRQSSRANQIDQNIFSINPYAILRPTSTTRLLFGYIFQETKYLNSTDEQQSRTDVNRYDNVYYADGGINISSRMTFTVGSRYTQERNNQVNYNQLEISGGPQYAYAENANIYARGGKTWFHFSTTENNALEDREYWFWDAGLSHGISALTLGFVTRRGVVLDPQNAVTLEDQYTLSLTRTMPRSTLTISGGWYEYRDATRDQRLTTSEQIQASLLYRLAPTTRVTLSGAYQDVNDLVQGGVSKIVLATVRLDQNFSEKDVVALQYGFVNSHSYDIPVNNYSNNRVLVEYRRTF